MVDGMNSVHFGFDPDENTPAYACIENDNGNLRIVDVWVLNFNNEKSGRDGLPGKCHMTWLVCAGAEEDVPVEEMPDGSFRGIVESLHYETRAANSRFRNVDPDDINRVNHITGAALAAFGLTARCLKPHEWKGSQTKLANQAAAYRKLGIDFDIMGGKDPKKQYCVPDTAWCDEHFPDIRRSDWKHISDAVAMALKDYDDYVKEKRMEKYS